MTKENKKGFMFTGLFLALITMLMFTIMTPTVQAKSYKFNTKGFTAAQKAKLQKKKDALNKSEKELRKANTAFKNNKTSTNAKKLKRAQIKKEKAECSLVRTYGKLYEKAMEKKAKQMKGRNRHKGIMAICISSPVFGNGPSAECVFPH